MKSGWSPSHRGLWGLSRQDEAGDATPFPGASGGSVGTPVSLYRANPGARGPSATRLLSLAPMVTLALLPGVPPHNRVSLPFILISSPAGRGANPTQERSQVCPALRSHRLCPPQRVSASTGAGWLAPTEGLLPTVGGTTHGPGALKGACLGTAVTPAQAGGRAVPARETLPSCSSPTPCHGWKRGTPTLAPQAQEHLSRGGNKEVSVCHHVPPGTFWPHALMAQLSAVGVLPDTPGVPVWGDQATRRVTR